MPEPAGAKPDSYQALMAGRAGSSRAMRFTAAGRGPSGAARCANRVAGLAGVSGDGGASGDALFDESAGMPDRGPGQW